MIYSSLRDLPKASRGNLFRRLANQKRFAESKQFFKIDSANLTFFAKISLFNLQKDTTI
ncbi:hypothetical protein ACWIUD_05010 [Helicobacter sp. 23-1044]